MKIGNFTPLCLKKEITTLNKIGTFFKSNALAFKFFGSEKVIEEIASKTKNSEVYTKQEIHNKVAFIVRKKLGNSPARNKIKRKLRSILAKLSPEHKTYLLIIAKPEAFDYPFDRLENEIQSMFAKIQKTIKSNIQTNRDQNVAQND